MVCLCKYHNWVTQGVGSLLNLVGPMVGAERENFENFESLDRWKWHFQSLLFAICVIEIRTLDMVFKFKNFFDLPLSLH